MLTSHLFGDWIHGDVRLVSKRLLIFAHFGVKVLYGLGQRDGPVCVILIGQEVMERWVREAGGAGAGAGDGG
eukprot:3551996-Rhodomonas_salina.2